MVILDLCKLPELLIDTVWAVKLNFCRRKYKEAYVFSYCCFKIPFNTGLTQEQPFRHVTARANLEWRRGETSIVCPEVQICPFVCERKLCECSGWLSGMVRKCKPIRNLSDRLENIGSSLFQRAGHPVHVRCSR